MKISQLIRKLWRFKNSDGVSSKQGCEGMMTQPHYYKIEEKKQPFKCNIMKMNGQYTFNLYNERQLFSRAKTQSNIVNKYFSILVR